MSSFPKAKRPASAKILDAWIRDRARAEGQVAERIRLGIGSMVVSAVLARMRAEDDTPLFVLKGGVAMQLRFEHRARSSAVANQFRVSDVDEAAAKVTAMIARIGVA